MGARNLTALIFIFLLLAGPALLFLSSDDALVYDPGGMILLYPTGDMELAANAPFPQYLSLRNYSGYDWATFKVGRLVGRPVEPRLASVSMSISNHGQADATFEMYLTYVPGPGDGEEVQMWFDPVSILPGESLDIDAVSESASGTLPGLAPGSVHLHMRQKETTYADIRVDLGITSSIVIPYSTDQPVAVAPADITVYKDQIATFDGSASYHGNAAEMTFWWDLNAANGIKNDTEGMIVHHIYQIVGTYTVTLKVFSGFYYDHDNLTVNVLDDNPPVLTLPSDVDSYKRTEVELSVVECYDPEGDPVTITWDMADGTVLQGRTVRHSYRQEGVYIVKVSATDSRLYNNRTVTITISNREPSADIEIEGNALIGSPITFRAVNVSDPDGDNVTYFNWFFGDGESGHGSETVHIYTASGYLTVTLVLSDGTENVQVTRMLDIPENVDPVARITGPSVAMVGEELLFSAADSADLEPHRRYYNWTYGDGQESREENLSVSYDSAGSKTIRLTVLDQGGGFDQTTHIVTIYEVWHFYPTEVLAEDLYVGFDCVEGPGDPDVEITYQDEDGVQRIAKYHGFRGYRLMRPDGKDCFVEVEVLEGGPVDILLLGGYQYQRFVSGEKDLLWKSSGTEISTDRISFQMIDEGEMYLVVNNDGRFVNGYEPVGGARYKVTIRYPTQKDPTNGEYIDEGQMDAAQPYTCCAAFIVLMIIITIVVVMMRAKTETAKRSPSSGKKMPTEPPRRVRKPREVVIDPYKNVSGATSAEPKVQKQPDWKGLDNRFTLSSEERKNKRKETSRPQYLKTMQPVWGPPREVDSAEEDPLMRMGENDDKEIRIQVELIDDVGEREKKPKEEELLDIGSIRKLLEERKKGNVVLNRVLPPPPGDD